MLEGLSQNKIKGTLKNSNLDVFNAYFSMSYNIYKEDVDGLKTSRKIVNWFMKRTLFMILMLQLAYLPAESIQ